MSFFFFFRGRSHIIQWGKKSVAHSACVALNTVQSLLLQIWGTWGRVGETSQCFRGEDLVLLIDDFFWVVWKQWRTQPSVTAVVGVAYISRSSAAQLPPHRLLIACHVIHKITWHIALLSYTNKRREKYLCKLRSAYSRTYGQMKQGHWEFWRFNAKRQLRPTTEEDVNSYCSVRHFRWLKIGFKFTKRRLAWL